MRTNMTVSLSNLFSSPESYVCYRLCCYNEPVSPGDHYTSICSELLVELNLEAPDLTAKLTAVGHSG